MVLRNIRKEQQVWGWLGKLMKREGVDLFVLEKLYRVVVQVVLIFGVDNWVPLAAMLKNLRTYMWVSYGR